MTTAFDPAYSSPLALPESLPLFQFSFEAVSVPSFRMGDALVRCLPRYPMLLARPRRKPRCSDSALALEPSLRSAPVVGVRVDVLLFADACVWETSGAGDATRYRDDDVGGTGVARLRYHSQCGARGWDEGSPALPPYPRQSSGAVERHWEFGAVFPMSNGTLRGGERDVRAACDGGSLVVSPCMRQWGALSSGVGTWCPPGERCVRRRCPRNGARWITRDGARGGERAARAACGGGSSTLPDLPCAPPQLRARGRSREPRAATSVFVLTDGEAWDLDAVLGEVRTAVEKAPESAPLRVSVLGIGDAVSTAMCEGIARVGHGVCMLVGEQETSFTGKIARLLKASKTPVISNISVDWRRPPAEVVTVSESEDDFEMVEEAAGMPKGKTLNVFDESVDPMHVDETQAPPPPSVILPAPPAIRNLFPGVRLNVYAILQGRTVPKTVILRASTAEGAEIELPIPVTLSCLQNDLEAPTAIHALAARKIIQDLEDGQHTLCTMLSNPDDTDLARTVKASIVRLGKTYSISSKHTSFVAVDETTPLLSIRSCGSSSSIPRKLCAPDLQAARHTLRLLHLWLRALRRRRRRRRGLAPHPIAKDQSEALARLQSFDGCFSVEVFTFVGLKETDGRALFPTGAADVVVATVLAMVFLSTKLGVEVERWRRFIKKQRNMWRMRWPPWWRLRSQRYWPDSP
ncbi:hypothetical protein B0H14DRAFT_2569892 [Mycena olivaceomarginata]|nr:hypothetical protein B0H14DRAFT_2569892 [Mycena olivaceomarginata]